MNKTEQAYMDGMVERLMRDNPDLTSEKLLKYVLNDLDTHPADLLEWVTARPETRPMINEHLQAGYSMVDAMRNIQLWKRYIYADKRRLVHRALNLAHEFGMEKEMLQ